MVKSRLSFKFAGCLVSSLILNLLFIINIYVGGQWNLSWSSRAAAEAEAVAATSCSGHGRAYLDGLVVDGNTEPVCECNACYTGPDCSQYIPHCMANADGGDPLFLEPFWLQHAASSALVVAGWHRMSYSFDGSTYISKELERLIRKVHALVGNAVTENRFIIFGTGSTQVLSAAAYALSLENSSSPAGVVASVPYYALYKEQAEYFSSEKFKFQGDANAWKNKSDTSTNMIEVVTSPNNPDGRLNKVILQGPNVKTIYDRAYYWPHFTPITAPADEDLMVFTLSKLSGHAGSRFGWAVVKDENVYNRMTIHMQLSSMGVSRESQLRAFKLLKAALEGEGRELFDFAYQTMKTRWERLTRTLSLSKRFSVQKINPQYCTFYNKFREFSPAYAWLKCEREEDKDCYAVLKEAKIIARQGNRFGSEDRYVRLSLVRSQDDFDILIQRLNKLVSEEDGAKIM
ncbi:PREDICTED: tryptophan aminotransferase-related protein 4 [Theobroma cacao]|uniref:Tryptophan aminotransferase-related protein 4 n=1 Tax=Theobroma cacao TaxID=3641 RepID=A0AB32UW02_THECC|nr:PREDICTED: tryptophan aminotransferase-related protein 4 [Theobroma cacao]